jgi:hypothetical protein
MKEIANHVHVIILFRVLAFVPPMLHCLMAHITYSRASSKYACHAVAYKYLQFDDGAFSASACKRRRQG